MSTPPSAAKSIVARLPGMMPAPQKSPIQTAHLGTSRDTSTTDRETATKKCANRREKLSAEAVNIDRGPSAFRVRIYQPTGLTAWDRYFSFGLAPGTIRELMNSLIDHASSCLSTHSMVAFSAAPVSTPLINAGQSNPRVLVLSPHPDDESLGCGGTMALLAQAGVPVDVAFMTRGEMGGKPGVRLPAIDQVVLANQRTQEATGACRTLGVDRIFFLSGYDGQVEQCPKLRDEILCLLESGNYGTVFAPWPFDVHKDHCATFNWLAAALEVLDHDLEIWLYEVWSTLHPNKLVPIDAVVEIKQQAIRAHVSQLHNYDYLAGFTALSQYRGFLMPATHYAEAFFVCNREEIFRFRKSSQYADRENFLHHQLEIAT